jgi:hypothetical protein
MHPRELLSFVHTTITTLWLMSVRDLDPEIYKSSENLSRPATTRAAQLRKDYMPSGKEAVVIRGC